VSCHRGAFAHTWSNRSRLRGSPRRIDPFHRQIIGPPTCGYSRGFRLNELVLIPTFLNRLAACTRSDTSSMPPVPPRGPQTPRPQSTDRCTKTILVLARLREDPEGPTHWRLSPPQKRKRVMVRPPKGVQRPLRSVHPSRTMLVLAFAIDPLQVSQHLPTIFRTAGFPSSGIPSHGLPWPHLRRPTQLLSATHARTLTPPESTPLG